jgi:hypothetical protein
MYQEGKMEGFTQTSYFSKVKRNHGHGAHMDDHRVGHEFDVSNCASHGAVAITVASIVAEPLARALEIQGMGEGPDRTAAERAITFGHSPMAIVLGHKEEFTFAEIMEFPHYMLMNHGSYWNMAGWTWWALLGITGLALVVGLYLSDMYGTRGRTAFDDRIRETFYWLAVVGFVAAVLEGIVHIGIAQVDVPVGSEFAVALFVVVLLPNAFALTLIFLNLFHDSEKIQTPVWAPLEFVTAFGMFTLLGAGIYVGPIFWCLAALVRLYRLLAGNKSLYG